MTMHLYCERHRTSHGLADDDVERVVYTLQAALLDAETTTGYRPRAGRDPMLTDAYCPMELLRWSHDMEMYGECADQGVERRVAVSS